MVKLWNANLIIIFFSPTSPKELDELVSSLENDKSSEIYIVILQKCFKLIFANVSGFFNKFVAAGIFPDILKTGKIRETREKNILFSHLLQQYKIKYNNKQKFL